MKKIPKQKKTNTREEKEILQEYFVERQKCFLDIYEKEINIIEKRFPLFAVDKTQVPCLLTMNIIDFSKIYMTAGEFNSFKGYVQDVLNGWKPPVELEVIQGGKK